MLSAEMLWPNSLRPGYVAARLRIHSHAAMVLLV